MAKFKTLINQLSNDDFELVRSNLVDNHAGKSVLLLDTVREFNLTDEALMDKLGVSANAYYALRSRLNQKIEEYLVHQMENPRTDIFKKVLMINEIIFTKSKEIAIATLKKLEKELIDYDLSNELTTVYKSLKKLTLHSPNYFHYSQLYNRHIAYMLAMDKAEYLLAEYLKKYGTFLLTGEEQLQLELTLMKKEMRNVCALYPSHRLFVYNSCLDIFHRLYVKDSDYEEDDLPTEDLLKENEKILNSYQMDTIYFHLKTVFDFFWLAYYDHFNVHRKVENYFNDLNIRSPQLLSNFHLYTFPSNFLILKLRRALRLNIESDLNEQNQLLYKDLQIDKMDIAQYYIWNTYTSLCAYYAGSNAQAISVMTELVNDVAWKKFPNAMLEARILLVFFHYINKDRDMAKLVGNSIQRQIRVIGKENCIVAYTFNQLLKTAMNDLKRNKPVKVLEYANTMNALQPTYYSPLKLIKIDDTLIQQLSATEPVPAKQN